MHTMHTTGTSTHIQQKQVNMAAAHRTSSSSKTKRSSQEQKKKAVESPEASNSKGNPSVKSDKYIHVHHYLNTGRWGTWFNDPTLKRGSGKRRLYFGTYETEYLAARAQDRAALKFRPNAVRPISRLNFAEKDYVLDKDLRDRLTNGQFRRLLMAESRKCYKRAEPSPCWRTFLEEEMARGNIEIQHDNGRQPMTFNEVLREILAKKEAVRDEVSSDSDEDPVDSTGDDDSEAPPVKRTRRSTRAAPNQAIEDVPRKERTNCISERAMSLSAQPVRTGPLVARPPFLRRLTLRSGQGTPQAVEANPEGPPVVRRDAENRTRNAGPLREAVPPILHRGDAKNHNLNARLICKVTPPVLRCDPAKRGVERVEGQSRSSEEESLRRSAYLDRLGWGRTRRRIMKNNTLHLTEAASSHDTTSDDAYSDEVAAAAASLHSMRMDPNVLSEISSGKATGSETTVDNLSRLNIDINRANVSEDSVEGSAAPPGDNDEARGQDDAQQQDEAHAVQNLDLFKAGREVDHLIV